MNRTALLPVVADCCCGPEEALVEEEQQQQLRNTTEDPMTLQESIRLAAGRGVVSPHMDFSQGPPKYEPHLTPYELTRTSPSKQTPRKEGSSVISPTEVTHASPRRVRSGRIRSAEQFRRHFSTLRPEKEVSRRHNWEDALSDRAVASPAPAEDASSFPLITQRSSSETDIRRNHPGVSKGRKTGGSSSIRSSKSADSSSVRASMDPPEERTPDGSSCRRSKSAGRADTRRASQQYATPLRRRRSASSPRAARSEGPSMRKTKQFARNMAFDGDTADRFLRGVVNTGFSVGKQVTECAILTADLYRQECTTHNHRGEDSMFFMRHGDDYDDYYDGSDDDGIQEKSSEDTDGLVEPPRLLNSARRQQRKPGRIVTPVETASVTPVETTRAWDMPGQSVSTDETKTMDTDDNETDLLSESIFRSLKGIRFPDATDIMAAENLVFPTLQRETQNRPRGFYDVKGETKEESKVERSSSSYAEFMANVQLPSMQFATEYTDLGQLRLHLFEQRKTADESDNSDALKYTRALGDLSAQDTAMAHLRKELEATRRSLERAQTELSEAQEMSARQRQATTQSSTKIFRERIDVEERLRRELKLNGELSGKIAEMEKEMERLAGALQESREKSTSARETKTPPPAQLHFEERSPQAGHRSPVKENEREASSVGGFGEEHAMLSSEIVALRAEVVDLRAQLAESRAARLATEDDRDRICRDRFEVIKEAKMLRAQNQVLKTEVEELQRSLAFSKQQGDQEAKRLQAEVTRMRLQIEQSQKEASAKVRTNQQLEEELTETQIEASKLRSQVVEIMKKLNNTKKEADEKVRVSDEEAKKLQEEVQRMKETFSSNNTEIIQQATDHLIEKQQLEEELKHAKQMAERMQHRILKMDGEIAQAESDAVQLRATMENERQQKNEASRMRRLSKDVMGFLKNRQEPETGEI